MAHSPEESNDELPRRRPEHGNTNMLGGISEKYEVVRRIGSGKYSEHFEGVNAIARQKCIISTIKPARNKSKIGREIDILQSLSGGPNIIALLDVVRDELTYSLIFEYIKNTDFRSLYPKFGASDVRFYVHELLKALEFCHGHGVMHRDVRPHNIMIDHEKRMLRLGGWDLAAPYRAGTSYSVRVSAPPFKAPELLLDFRAYGCSVDMWSVGAVFAAMVFRREPFFHGSSNMDLVLRIAGVLGTETLLEYVARYGIELDEQYDEHLRRETVPRKPWRGFVNAENEGFVTDEALDFLDGLLRYDHEERLTAGEALAHPFLEPVRNGV